VLARSQKLAELNLVDQWSNGNRVGPMYEDPPGRIELVA